ncbi:hypothetical protein FRB99_003105 [Tulasnella sp. 403]|nr:hypothetical protein FRB99_003105 [Tulasnella sp. 403]
MTSGATASSSTNPAQRPSVYAPAVHKSHRPQQTVKLSRFARLIGLSQFHTGRQPYKHTNTPSPQTHSVDGEWVAVAMASSSSFGGGQGDDVFTMNNGSEKAWDGGREGGPLTPFMATPNPFGRPPAKPWDMDTGHSHSHKALLSAGSGSAAASLSSLRSPVSSKSSSAPPPPPLPSSAPPALASDPLASLRGRSVPKPGTSHPSAPLTTRLRTSGLFPMSSNSPTISPISSKGSVKRPHYQQPSFFSLDGGAGIGESPSPSSSKWKGKAREIIVKDKDREKEREKIRKREKDASSSSSPSGGSLTVNVRERRISPLSLSQMLGHSSPATTTQMIGPAIGVRTSLLGFGANAPPKIGDDSDAISLFGNPRKAPLPPGVAPIVSPVSSVSVYPDDRLSPLAGPSGHARKLSETAGGTLVTLREEGSMEPMDETMMVEDEAQSHLDFEDEDEDVANVNHQQSIGIAVSGGMEGEFGDPDAFEEDGFLDSEAEAGIGVAVGGDETDDLGGRFTNEAPRYRYLVTPPPPVSVTSPQPELQVSAPSPDERLPSPNSIAPSSASVSRAGSAQHHGQPSTSPTSPVSPAKSQHSVGALIESHRPYPSAPPSTAYHTEHVCQYIQPEESAETPSHKPPIPPKYASTFPRRTLKEYASAPNLVAMSEGNPKGKEREGEQGGLSSMDEGSASASAHAHHGHLGPSRLHDGSQYHTIHRSQNLPVPPAPPAVPGPPPPPPRRHLLRAQTICDAFMFPKPRFIAHVISPPETPEMGGRGLPATSQVGSIHSALNPQPEGPAMQDVVVPPTQPWALSPPPSPLTLEKVMRDGAERERERHEWAAKAKGGLSRGLSLSLKASVANVRSTPHSHGDALSRSDAEGKLSVGLVNRLRARTLSGLKSAASSYGHRRGGSKETTGSSKPSDDSRGGGAKIGGSRNLRYKRSYDLVTTTKMFSVSPDPIPLEAVAAREDMLSPASAQTTSSKPSGLGKQGKLTIAVDPAAADVAHESRASATVSTDRNSHSLHTHSRKSSYTGGLLAPGPSQNDQPPQHLRAPHRHVATVHGRSRSGSATSVASALRKVRSLCGPDELSPALESGSFGAEQDARISYEKGTRSRSGSRNESRNGSARGRGSSRMGSRAGTRRESLYEDDMYEVDADGRILEARHRTPSDVREETESDDEIEGGRDEVDDVEPGVVILESYQDDDSELEDEPVGMESVVEAHLGLEPEHRSIPSLSPASHLDMDDADEEPGEIHQVHRISVTPAQISTRPSVQSFGPIDFSNLSIRPVMAPSPAPSSYHGVYGIAIGTPSPGHPFSRSPSDRELPTLPAGPHPSSPTTYLQIPPAMQTEISSRHRLPPHRTQAQALPPRRGSSVDADVEMEDAGDDKFDERASTRPLPPTAPSSPSQFESHPYAAQPPPPPKNFRMSVNSVEAMFGGELLQSSHTVSPLGVREAGANWVNATDADLKAPGMVLDDASYRHSRDSGLGSSTDLHSQSRPKASRAVTMSSAASLLVESPPGSMYPSFRQHSPPPSMFPSFRQERLSAKFDSMTFGGGDDRSVEMEDTGAMGDAPLESPKASSSSATSSGDGTPKPLGSSDDLESFKDLFYVPRSRQPSASSPKFRRSEHSSSSGGAIEPVEQAEAEAFLHSSLAVDSRQRGRILSPLSSVLTMEMRQSFSDMDTPSFRHSSAQDSLVEEPRGGTLFHLRSSVYDTIEEESIRSDVERFSDENFRVGMVSVLSPNIAENMANRRSAQLSLVDADERREVADDLMALRNAPFLQFDTPDMPSRHFRASYMTATSGTSIGNRMSHIISDFPVPPIHDHSSGILDYYGVSPDTARDTLSLAPSKPYSSASSVPSRSDTFGP